MANTDAMASATRCATGVEAAFADGVALGVGPPVVDEFDPPPSVLGAKRISVLPTSKTATTFVRNASPRI